MSILCPISPPVPELLAAAGQAVRVYPGGVTGPAAHDAIDAFETALIRGVPVVCPLEHEWVPGMYIRRIVMPAGSIITSKVHRTRHPYVVTRGHCKVWIDGTGWVDIFAPHQGITEPGTRRVLFIIQETEWTTYHPATEAEVAARSVDMVEARIIEPRGEHLVLPLPPEPVGLPRTPRQDAGVPAAKAAEGSCP